MSEQFKQLVERKFGNKRGYVSNAATKLQINQGNLSAMLRGRISIAQKHIDALNALPDYAPPSGITQELYQDGAVHQLITWFTVRLSPQAASDLEFIARVHTKPGHHMPDLGASESATTRLMEIILAEYRERLYANDPGACVATNRKIAEEKAEARKQLNFELGERKHLVADELTENEINDDVDPLA